MPYPEVHEVVSVPSRVGFSALCCRFLGFRAGFVPGGGVSTLNPISLPCSSSAARQGKPGLAVPQHIPGVCFTGLPSRRAADERLSASCQQSKLHQTFPVREAQPTLQSPCPGCSCPKRRAGSCRGTANQEFSSVGMSRGQRPHTAVSILSPASLNRPHSLSPPAVSHISVLFLHTRVIFSQRRGSWPASWALFSSMCQPSKASSLSPPLLIVSVWL